MEEEMFLGLRKKSGVSMARFEEKFGQSLLDFMEKLSEIWFNKASCRLRVTTFA